MRLRPAGPPLSTLAPTRSLIVVLAIVLSGCGRDLVVDFTDYAHYQRDHVTTRLVPAHSDLITRLTEDGWRVDREDDDRAVLRMTRDRVRIWFFSADGATTRAELYGGVTGDPTQPLVVSYRLNGEHQAISRWAPDAPTLELPFEANAARPGWNALDLYVRRDGSEGLPELEGIRFIDDSEESLGDESPLEISVVDGDLLTPAESFLDVSFEVPSRAQFRAHASADPAPARGRDQGRIQLMDPAGAWHELSLVQLEAGDSEGVRVSLSEWVGEIVTVRISVTGPRGSGLRWSEATVVGEGSVAPAVAPVLPAQTEASSRLGRPDVFVIVLDAARAAAFGVYGAEHPTPAVDRLAAEGTRFARALAPAPWTGQSIPALLAGFHPDTLGIERWGDPLPDKVPNVAELMAGAGYRTVLWSQHPIYNRADSLVRGFARFKYSGRHKRARLPSRQFLFERGRPTFAMLHLLPPHSPYTPPKPFRGAYTSGYKGELGSRLGALGRIGKKRALQLTREDHAYIYGRYLENVAYADSLVGKVVAMLESTGRYRNALILVTADHGEAFFEHDLFMHSRELYDEFIHIPMVVKWPAAATGFAPVIDDAASLIDILPTLVDGLGLPGGEGGFQGRSLLPVVFDGAPLERPIYSTTRGLGDIDRTAKPRWMLEVTPWKVVHDPVAGRTELYALDSDAGEHEDVAGRYPTIARLMLQRLLMQRRFNLDLLQLGPRAELELDPELVEELKALGYL